MSSMPRSMPQLSWISFDIVHWRSFIGPRTSSADMSLLDARPDSKSSLLFWKEGKPVMALLTMSPLILASGPTDELTLVDFVFDTLRVQGTAASESIFK